MSGDEERGRGRSGFVLTAVMMTIGFVGVGVGMIFPKYRENRIQVVDVRTRAECERIGRLLFNFRTSAGVDPTTLDELKIASPSNSVEVRLIPEGSDGNADVAVDCHPTDRISPNWCRFVARSRKEKLPSLWCGPFADF